MQANILPSNISDTLTISSYLLNCDNQLVVLLLSELDKENELGFFSEATHGDIPSSYMITAT